MRSRLLCHATALPAGFGLVAGSPGGATAAAHQASFRATHPASTTQVNVTPGNDDDRWTKAGVGVSTGAWQTSGGVQDSIFSNVGLPVRGW